MPEKPVYFHATEPENAAKILREGLIAPVYLMKGKETADFISLSVSRIYAQSGVYKGGNQVLLKVELPVDWPVQRDEASETDQYMKSLKSIPAQYISIESSRWP